MSEELILCIACIKDEHTNVSNNKYILLYFSIPTQRFGHCRVPHGYADNRKLSWWVMNQRAQHQLIQQGRRSWLTQERIDLLNAIGFNWKPAIASRTNREEHPLPPPPPPPDPSAK